MIVDINNQLYKIQIKYCDHFDNSAAVCQCSSSYNHTTNKRYRSYIGQVDFFVFYISEWNKIILVPINKIKNKKYISFRNSPAKNNQTKNINYVDDYTFDKYFKD